MNKSDFVASTYNKIANIYTNQYFEDLSDVFFINKFLAYFPKKAKILDVGSGPGQFTKYLLDKGFEVEGVDLSEEMIKIAEKKVPNARFKVMDMRNLKYPANTFSGLLVAYSLIHIPSGQIPNTLLGFNKILKNKGYIEIIVQMGDADKTVDEPLKKGEKIFVNLFTKKRLRDFLTNAGFKIIFQEETASQDPDSLSNKVIYVIARKLD